ncbi:GPR1/FUN34/yaaH family-domain-containing protein [Tribonema minus]|uniref:GPR1/FUN34/yaaH family-domain-containing protein n=1 Tax=Tribonema minus TaxID=303371 RepID=A0A836CCL6_9STRA|nr:GPR1/FUN34/yaaH family-domain-containing protein [Tribonema minus]
MSANPAPLGLCAFSITLAAMMFVETKLASSDFENYVACIALFTGGLAQFVAGVFTLRRGTTFSAVIFCSYAAFWFTWGLMKLVGTWTAESEDFDTAEPMYLSEWTIFTILMFCLSFKECVALRVTILLTAISMALLAAGRFDEDVLKVGGYFGLAASAGAAYIATSAIAKENYGFYFYHCNT